MEHVRRRHFEIPRGVLELLEEQPRFVIEPAPGFWPIDIGILRKTNILDKLAADKAFNEHFEIVIMPK